LQGSGGVGDCFRQRGGPAPPVVRDGICACTGPYLGKSTLAADRKVFVAIGELGHHRNGQAVSALRHQAAKSALRVGEGLRRSQAACSRKFVIWRDRRKRAQGSPISAQPLRQTAEREHRRPRGGAQVTLVAGKANKKCDLIRGQVESAYKAGTGEGI